MSRNIFMECFCFHMPGVYRRSIKSIHKLVARNASYMFTKKSCIIKKIWKFSKLSSLRDQSPEINDIKRKLHCLFKTFNEEELDTLLKTLQSNGGIESDCICIRPNEYRHVLRRTSNFDPRITLAQTFRFPQMTDEFLRILPCCCNHNSCYENVCINPYHSSLVVDSEPPLPPYSKTLSPETLHTSIVSNEQSTEVSTASTSSATDSITAKSVYKSTNQESSSFVDSDRNWFSTWCRITYWEEKTRIGQIFDVSEDSINVFENLPQGGGFCLSLLSNNGNLQKESSQKMKEHIGYGFQLTRESEGIWLYNRSDIVLFAGSPTIQLESVTLTQPVVKRLPPGTSVLVYDPSLVSEVIEKNIQLQEQESSSRSSVCSFSKSSGSTKNNSPFCVRVSFGKGWGENYTRMSITQCPCWVEIYLNV